MSNITVEQGEAYARAAAPKIGDNSMAVLYTLAERQLKAEGDVARAEDELKKAQERLASVQEHELPEEMERLGMKEFTLQNGLSVSVRTILRASVAGDRMPAAIKWLRENGAESLIKRDVTVSFGKGEDKKATELIKRLMRSVRKYAVGDEESVNTATLKSYVQEKLTEGYNIPLELLGAYQQKQSVIERPGEAKSKKGRKAVGAEGAAPF